MKFVIKYEHENFWSEDITPIDYESKEKLIKDFTKAWRRQHHNFSFLGTMFLHLTSVEKYEFLTLDEWFDKYKIG